MPFASALQLGAPGEALAVAVRLGAVAAPAPLLAGAGPPAFPASLPPPPPEQALVEPAVARAAAAVSSVRRCMGGLLVVRDVWCVTRGG
jgi:hypothetical protein